MYALVLALLAGYRWWQRRGPARLQPVTGPLAAAGLLGLGAAAGLSAGQLGLTGDGAFPAIAVVVLTAVVLAVALAVPATRGAFREARREHPVRDALVGIPLATVAVEEAAFRGLLWGLVARDHGVVAATAVTAVLFGLWHLGRLRDVAVTTVAGVLFGVLREAGGGLLAPVALHWAANGLAVLAAAWAGRWANDRTAEG